MILEAAGAVVANNLAQGQEALDRPPGRLADRLLRGSRRRKRSALHRRPHSEVSARRRTRPKRKTPEGAHCAVLYRTNAQSRLVEEALRRYNISYTMVGGFSFYERAEIKDLLGYLRLVRNPHDSMACSGSSTPRPAASAKPRWKRWSGWLWRPASPPGTLSPPPSPTASSPRAR
jgi:DNA helicase-2/ATP-dependent DNA helicase PcrA